MKREDSVRKALSSGCKVPTDMPMTLRGIRIKVMPVQVGRDIVDRTVTYLRFQLPNGDFMNCRAEGNMAESSLVESCTKDPYFKPFFDLLNPKKAEKPDSP